MARPASSCRVLTERTGRARLRRLAGRGPRACRRTRAQSCALREEPGRRLRDRRAHRVLSRPWSRTPSTDSGFDADLVEAIVFLESGGRPDVIAGDDPVAASGLTQILAETGQNFLGMDVDLEESRRLTAQNRQGASNAVTRAQADRLRGSGRRDRRAVRSRAGARGHRSLPHHRSRAAGARTTSPSSRTTWESAT